MPTAQFSGAVVSYNVSSRKVTVRDFIQDNLLPVSLIVGISFSLFCVSFFVLGRSQNVRRKDSRNLLNRH